MNELTITANLPFGQMIYVRDGKDLWPDLASFEVKAQLRAEPGFESRLIDDIDVYMTKAFSDNDIAISWVMTGAQTRALYDKAWGNNKSGYCDIVLSDVGVTDARAVRIPLKLYAKEMTTVPAGV